MSVVLDAPTSPRPVRPSRIRSIAELFFRRLTQSTYARRREQRRFVPMYFESLEPRVLLSATLEYPANVLDAAIVDLTLTADLDGTDVKLNLRETGNLGNIVASTTLDAGGDSTVEIRRAGGEVAQTAAGDTIKFDLTTFNLAALATFVNGDGGLLDISFVGGTDLSILNDLFDLTGFLDDQVQLIGESATTIPFNLKVRSSSDILLTAGASGNAITIGNLTLESDSEILIMNAEIAAADLTLKAGKPQTVTGDADSLDFLQLPSAIINITDSVLSGANVVIEARAELDVTINFASAFGGFLSFAELILIADATVIIDGSDITATGFLNIDAITDIDATLQKKPDTSNQDSDTSTDAAVAVAFVYSDTTVHILGNSHLVSTGTTDIDATHTLGLETTADGTLGNSSSGGAVVAVSIVIGDTELIVENSTIQASAITLDATTSRTVDTLAKAAAKGATSGSDTQESQKRLDNPDGDNATNDAASTGQGELEFAATVAVTVVTGHTWAEISGATLISGGTIGITASAMHDISTIGDGSFTDDSAPGVGVGVAIGVHVVEAKAWIAGATSIDATAVTLKAIMPQSHFDVQAKSGASGDGSGLTFAGALAINVTIADTYAEIASSAILDLNHDNSGLDADLTIQAMSTTDASAKAEGSAGGGSESTGVGASVSFIIVDNDTKTRVGSNATFTDVDAVHLTATGNHGVVNEAKGGTEGGTAITPVVAVTIVTLDTSSVIASGGGALVSGDDFFVDADSTADVSTKAEGSAIGGDAAVGAAIAFTWAQDAAVAEANRSITSGGDTRFQAKSRATSKSEAKASAEGAEGEDDDSSGQDAQGKADAQKSAGNQQASNRSAGGKTAQGAGDTSQGTATGEGNENVSVAAAISINAATSTTRAEIADGVTIVSDGLLTVRAESNVDGSAMADGSVANAGTGIAAAVAINIATVDNIARIGSANVTADGVSVRAQMRDVPSETPDKHTFKAEATSGAAADDVGIAGSFALNYADVDTQAVIKTGATINIQDGSDGGGTTGPIELVATSVTENVAKALPDEDSDGEGGADTAGIGASLALNLVFHDTTAEMQNGVIVSGSAAGSLTAAATGTHEFTTEAENGAKGGVGVGAAVAVVISNTNTTGRIGTGAGTIALAGGATITATHRNTLTTTVKSEAEGEDAAVGASVGVVIVDDSATATLARSVSGGGLVTIKASSEIASTLDVQASAGGESSDGDDADSQASSNVNNNSNVSGNASADTRNLSGASASGNTSSANSSANSESGAGGSGVGVAAAVAVNYIRLDNTAQITNGADVTTTGAVVVRAEAHVDATSKATGLAVTLNEDDKIGAAVGVNVGVVNNRALVSTGSVVQGHGVTLEAVTKDNETNDFIVWGAAAAGGTGGVGVAGSVAVNVLDFSTEASAAAGSHLKSTAGLTVAAENDMTIQTLAAGAGFTGNSSAVGAAIAVTVVPVDTIAAVDDADAVGAMNITAETTIAPPPTLDIPDNDLIDDPAIAVSSVAIAGGASAGGVGIAGAVSVNVYSIDTKAFIRDGAQINQDAGIPGEGTSVKVQAISTTKVTNVAGAIGISTDSVGVGAGLDVTIITKTTEAYIGSSAVVDSAGTISVDADSSEEIISVAANAGIGNSVGVAGSISVQVITTTTRAYTGNSSNVEGGGVLITADGTLKATLVAGSVGASAGSAGVGAANTTLVHTDIVEAYVGNNATVGADTTTGIVVDATSSEELITIAAAGGAASTAGVAGSAVVNVLNETTTARIGRSANVTSDNGIAAGRPNVTVEASDETTIVSVAGNLAAGGTAGVGLGADVGTITKHTKAYIDSGVVASVEGNIFVSAGSEEDITSVAAGMSAAGTAAVALDASVHVLTIETKAFIGDEPGGLASAGAGDVHAGGNISVTANEVTEIDKIVGVLAVAGTAGVGAAGAVTVIDKNTEAFIGAGAKVTADGLTPTMSVATGKFDVTPDLGSSTFDPSNAGGEGVHASSLSSNPNASSLAGAGEVKTPNLADMDADQSGSGTDANDPALQHALIRAAASRSGFRGLSVSATNRDDIEAFTISVAGGTAGVAISAGVNIVTNNTLAYIGANADVEAEAVNVAAGNDFYHLAVAGTLGVGVVGVSPAADVTVLSNTTTAEIRAGATVDADDDVRVEAHAAEHLLQITMGIGGGVVGIGGGVGVGVMTNTTTASIGAATVNADGDVAVMASDETHITMVSGGLAGGFVGVGASVGVMVVNKETTAFVGDGAIVNAKGAGAGIQGVMTGTFVGGDAANDFATGEIHGVIVQAVSREEVLHLVLAAGAGFVGVAGAVGVTVIDSNTTAYIGNADINLSGTPDPDQSVYVNAGNEARMRTLVVGAAGGFVGVGGAVDVGVMNNDTKAEIRSGASVKAANDVEVNALGIHEVDGFTFSGAGGVVGLTAAVSVWSIGTPMATEYSDGENPSQNALQGENGAADADAANQAQATSDQVSGLMGGFSGDGGNAKTSRNRVNAGMGSASGRINSDAPNAGDLSASASPDTGTVASIAGGTVVTAGDDINVTAREDLEVNLIVGGVAGGLLGVGASIAVLNTGVSATASAGGTLTAGDDINVIAALDEDIDVVSVAGAAGFVGLGAVVVVIDDESTVSAGILGGAVVSADAVAVSASTSQTLHGFAGQVTVGAIGAGAAFVTIDVDNDAVTDTRAFIGNNVTINGGSVSVTATSTIDAHAETFGLSAGIGAFSVNFASVSVTPEISATIGTGASINVSGAVVVSATGTPRAHAETFGVNAGGLAVGASIADAEATAIITASIAGTIVAGSLSVNATQAHGGGYNALAETTGSAGALIGVDATVSNTTNNGAVRAFVADNATLTITNATTVAALNNNRQKADANSNVGGLVAAGISASNASSNTTTEAYLGQNVKLTGKSLTLTAIGTDDNFADTVAGTVGAIAVSAATAETHNTSTTTAEIRQRTGGSSRSITLLTGAGTLDIKAEHTAKFNGRTRAFAGGLFGGAGAEVDNHVDADVTARVGANAIVLAKDIEIEAINHTNKQFLGTANVDGTTAGLVSGGYGDSDTEIALHTIVDIGAGASLTVVGSVVTPGDFVLRTLNDIVAKDKVNFWSAGLASGLVAGSHVVVTEDLSRVQIGNNATLTNTVGDIDIFARGTGDVRALVNAEAYGVGTFIGTLAEAIVHPHNEISVGSGATLHAKGDLSLYAGTDVNFVRDNYYIEARSDAFAGSAIPINDVNSTTAKVTRNTISIASGALLETAGMARLHAEKEGFANLQGSAKAVSWVSEVQDWINGSTTVEMNDASLLQEAHSFVHMNGTVRTGIERHKLLELSGGRVTDNDFDPDPDTITVVQNIGGVTFTIGQQQVESSLIQELQFAQDQLNKYGASNPSLKTFYEGEIARIEALLIAQGLGQTQPNDPANPGAGSTTFPVAQDAWHVYVDPLVAMAGRIDVRADVLNGSGLFDAPSDASVRILNHTPAFLVINGIVIPDVNGGLYLNGVPVTTNAAINESNLAQALSDGPGNEGPGDSDIIPGVASFGPLPNPVTSDPEIHVVNDFAAGHVGPGETYPWPNIIVAGPISNLSGLVHLHASPTVDPSPGGAFAGEGSILINASVEAETLEIHAGGTVVIDLGDIPNSKFNTGSEPFTQWDPITLGRVPGTTNPLYEGLGSAFDSNDDGVVNASDSNADITNLLAKTPSKPTLVGDRVYITAEYINNDGLIQSGVDTWTLNLGANTVNEIGTLGGATGWVVLTNPDVANSGFVVRYDTATGDIIVDDVSTKGGYVDLTGHILNTANGKIRVLGGYAHVNITNTTGRNLVLYKIDEQTAGYGQLIIKDKAKTATTPGGIYTTIYTQVNGGAVSKIEDAGSGPIGGDSTLTHYNPNTSSGWRYGWSVGVETFTRDYYHEHTSAWLGIDFLAADPPSTAWTGVEVLSAPHLLDGGPYYFKNAAITDAYTFDQDEIVGSSTFYVTKKTAESTWYGTTTYHKESVIETRSMHVFTHSIEADRPIAVEFIGFTSGSINVGSNADIVLRGQLLNPSGTTTLTATGQIRQESDEAIINSKSIVLSGSVIGQDVVPIRTNLSEVSTASLKATTGGGQIHITEVFGDMLIDQVVSAQGADQSGGRVVLSAHGGMYVATGKTGRVEGGAITLYASPAESIGTLAAPILLDTGEFPWDKLNVGNAVRPVGDVFLKEADGNLRIELIYSVGDVRLEVLSGGIVDGNEVETRDERTIEQLRAGVWHELALTATADPGDFDVHDKIQDAKDALARQRESDYKAYWIIRETQAHAPLTVTVTDVLDTGTYYAIVSGNQVKLAATAADAMAGRALDIATTGASGAAHRVSTTALGFDSQVSVDGAADSIRIVGHGLTAGAVVVYDANGGGSIGLSDGTAYFVSVVDADRIRLETSLGGGFVDLTPTGSAGTQKLWAGAKVFDPATAVNSGADTIDLGAGHGITTGAVVYYDPGAGGTGLQTIETQDVQEGGSYYVIVVDANTIKLAATPGGPALDLGHATASGLRHQLKSVLSPDDDGVFDPVNAVNAAADTITIVGHGFSNDEEVVYLPNVYDPNFQAELSATEEAFYVNKLGYTPAQIAALEASRTEQYHTLHGQVGAYTDTFDPGFTYTLTSAEESFVESRIHVFTEDELIYSISAGLLKDIADTTISIEAANIVANNVTLITSAGVGEATSVLLIDVSGGVHTLSDAERVALGAAERTDVAFLGPAVTASMDVINGNTLHLNSGTWNTSLYAPDTRIRVFGGANATAADEFYVVQSVSGANLVLNKALIDQDGVVITVRNEVNNPTAPGVDIDLILIDQREDVDLEVIGKVKVSAHASVYLGSEERSINLDLVQTDLDDEIRIKSGQGITNAVGAVTVNIIGGDTILEAANGAIGTAVKNVNLNLGPIATITGRALGDIYLYERVGDMNLEFMFSQTGDVHLTADDDLLDALNTHFTKISANNIFLLAVNGGIGEPGDWIDIDANAAGVIVADAHDDIFISETFGNMNVQHVQSNFGNVDLKALVSILDANADGFPDVIGNSITLAAAIGGIGAALNDLDVNTRFSGAGVLKASSGLANIFIIETDGSGPTIDDLYLDVVSTEPGFTAFITAPEGSILNSNVSPHNVVSGRAYLVALNNIGAAGNPLTTNIGNLEGKSILGSTWIVNTGGLETGGVVDTGEPGMVAGGDITVTADSPIDVIENIVAANIMLNARDDSADDHIVIHSGFRLETAVFDFVTKTWERSVGTITLQAGDSFLLESGAKILTLGTVYINGDFNTDDIGTIIPGNNDPGVGAQIVVNGHIEAPQIIIQGNDDDDSVLIDIDHPANSLIGHLVILGGDGDDLVVINELHTRHTDIDGVPGFDTVDIDGQGGTDATIVNVRADATGTDYVINVTDSGAPDDGADTLTINGTEIGDARNPDGQDLFLVRRNFVAYLTPDPAHLPAPDPNHLLPGVERINYDESINGRLIVNGGSGNDAFYVDDNSSITTLDGGAGDDFFQIGQIFGSRRQPPDVAPGDEIATQRTTRGWLSVGTTFPLVAYGGSGNDTLQVYSNKAEIRLEGNAGDDTFIIRAFVLADEITGAPLKDLSTAAQTAVLGGDGNDLMQYSVNAPVDIDGGSGFNRIVVLGTEFSDSFVISEEGIFGAGLHITYANIQSITVDGLEGNDNFFILGTPPDVAVNVVGGIGWDTFNVGGDVTLPIVSRDLEGVSAVINHQVTSADLGYHNLPAAGVQVHVATPESGQIVITESGGATVVSEAGETEDSFEISLAEMPLFDVFITISAAAAPSELAALLAQTLRVSIDGGATYQPAAVVKFAAGTAAGTKKTVKVKAVDDPTPEGDGLVMVSMSSFSLDPAFNHVAIRNVKVQVLDDDQPGVRLTHTDLDTVVLEEDAAAGTHGIADTYSVVLAKAPAAGQTVTVTLDPSDARLALTSLDARFNAVTRTITFNHTNWDDDVVMAVAANQDLVVQNPVKATISHVIGGTDASYASFFATRPAPKLPVTLLDTDGPGVYVRETDGSTLVVEGDPVGDSYSVRLTAAPTAPVTLALLTDDRTLVSNPGGNPHAFTAAVLDGDGLLVTPATITFTAGNWFIPFVVKVVANPDAPESDAVQPLKFFDVQPHIVSTNIQGPLSVDGSVGDEDRSLRRAVILPTETDPGPFDFVPTTDDTQSVDTLNIFNDGSGANDVGTLTGTNLFMNGMGPDLHFVGEDGTPHDFAKGITYKKIETLEIMLGRGHDQLTINGTMALANVDGVRGPLTIVHGGGGNDTIVINGGGGTSPLVVFGDTSEDGSRYTGVSGVASVNAVAFTTHGNDTIDARNATQSLVLFGGRGNDTIWGSQAGDHIAGGSGHDTIYAEGGDDIVYGDNGFNVGKTTVMIPEPNADSGVIARTLYNRVLVTVFAESAPLPGPVPDTHDTLTPGMDTIRGGAGHDTLFGDFGLVTQTVVETLLSTSNRVRVESKSNANGADDRMYGDAGDDILIGNTGNDALDGGLDRDLIFGDNVFLDRTTNLGNFTNPRFRALTGTQLYSTATATDGQLLVNTTSQYADPRGSAAAWADYLITFLDHTATTAPGLYGNDYIAGGGHDDMIFGQLGDDTIQGDGSIDEVFTGGARVGAYRDAGNNLVLNPSFDAATDGHDYIEGNGGNDVIFGNLGQDDILGGSSSLFSLTTPHQRPDGSDMIFGGSGNSPRNHAGDTSASGHANDADTIVGDNSNIYRLVGVNNAPGGAPTFGGFLTFAYDNYSATAKIVVRGVQYLDYTPGGPDYAPTAAKAATDIGASDELHGDGGDDTIYGLKGNDTMFGDGQDDDLYGGYGNDWMSGGTGNDGLLGDDGRLFTSRNGTAEPLYGIGSLAGQLNQVISTPGGVQQATINVSGQLKKTAHLAPFSVDVTFNGTQDEFGGSPTVAHKSDDIMFGGLGDDSMHGGSGDDAMSGAEAPVEGWAQRYNAAGVLVGVVRTDYGHPLNLPDGDILRYNPDDPNGWHKDPSRRSGEFAVYDEYDPLRKILLNDDGTLSKTGTGKEFFLNFVSTEGVQVAPGIFSDGNDVLFGDLGNDMLFGGTGRDNLYGGWGNDYIQADDVLTTAGGLNNAPDTAASYEDRVYGGAGRDVLIANTGGDRLIDWVGEFNTYLVPFAPFGTATVSRTLQPQLAEFLYALSRSDGADPSRAQDTGADPLRNGEPEGELGLLRQQDFAFHDQTGAPADPQAGNVPGGKRDVLRSANFNDASMQGFFADSGKWQVSGGVLQVSASSPAGDAVAVYHVGDALPTYFEVLGSVQVIKPTGGWKGNAYLIFDYVSATDFKFAGIDVSTNKVVIGQRTSSGWTVDRQTPFLAKADVFYNMMLSINGLTATLTVNNSTSLSFTYAPRVVDGYSYALNWGLVGIGSDSSRGAFDNVQVQVVERPSTFNKTEDFSTAVAAPFTGPVSGTWTQTGGRYAVTPPAGGIGSSLMQITAPPVSFQASSVLDLAATVNAQGRAGFIFDRYSDSDFKFVMIDAPADKVLIGHYTAKGGWVIDASASRVILAGTDYVLGMVAKGQSVSVTLNGQAMVGFVYNAPVVDGAFGLLATGGAASFDDVKVRSDDPSLAGVAPVWATAAESGPMATPGAGPGRLTNADLRPVVDAAKQYWVETLGAHDPRLAALATTDVMVGNLPVDRLGVTKLSELGHQVIIDPTASGYGWFIDTSRWTSVTPGRMDLFTVVAHELGNAMGIAEDPYATELVTSPILAAGDRNLLYGTANGGTSAAGAGSDGQRGTGIIDWHASGETPLATLKDRKGRSLLPAMFEWMMIDQKAEDTAEVWGRLAAGSRNGHGEARRSETDRFEWTIDAGAEELLQTLDA